MTNRTVRDSRRLEGRVALVTGAARGQGRSHALRLAQEGADILAIDICEQIPSVEYPLASQSDLNETGRMVAALGREVVTVKADVRDLHQMTSAVEQGVRALGGLDIVSANAGISSVGPSHELPESTWQDVLDVNLTGVWHTCRAAVPEIIRGRRGGSVVITSSVVGIRGSGSLSHYSSAKHGVVGLMESMANELGRYSIRVNTIHPTQVDTDMIMNPSLFSIFRPDLQHPTREDVAPVSQSMMILPHPWIEPVDVSNALLFLVSDDARFITGTTLRVDLGHLTKIRMGDIAEPRKETNYPAVSAERAPCDEVIQPRNTPGPADLRS